jgi:hypothetical protein
MPNCQAKETHYAPLDENHLPLVIALAVIVEN